jgi:AcrR family transcriptional regulator
VTGAAAPVRCGRPRSQLADDAILTATLDVLREKGYGGLTVAAVIERAGVSSATLYRRWPAKQDLVAAALASLTPELIATDTGTLAGDLAAFLERIAASIAVRDEDVADSLTREAKRNPDLAAALREKFIAPRLHELSGILHRAVGRGEIVAHPSVEAFYSLVSGPLYHRAFVLAEAVTPAFIKQATTFALRGLGTAAGEAVSARSARQR